MSIENDIEQLELSMENARHAIDMVKALERLRSNKDFEKIISNGYFKEEASRVVLLRGDLNATDEMERHCDKQINGIGVLRSYFQKIQYLGSMAEKALAEHQETREELLREQLEGGE